MTHAEIASEFACAAGAAHFIQLPAMLIGPRFVGALRWTDELERLSPLPARIVRVMTLGIVLCVFGLGVTVVMAPGEVAGGGRLGTTLAVFLGVFWSWRAWIQAGCPRPDGPAWGSFEDFVETAVSAVRWLGWPDPIGDRASRAAEMDGEAQALRVLLGLWCEVMGDEPVSCGESIDRLGGGATPATVSASVQAVRDALAGLGVRSRWPPGPTPSHLGKALSGQAGTSGSASTPAGALSPFWSKASKRLPWPRRLSSCRSVAARRSVASGTSASTSCPNPAWTWTSA